jgi:nitroreductase
MAEHEAGITPESEYQYYPRKFFEPFHSRRRKVGWDLYGLLGIGKGDSERMRAQHARNLVFFDAPVGLIFTIHRDLEQGSWLDYGMFLQNVMVAARGMGLDTCPQAAFMPYHRTIQTMLDIPPEEMLVCGMALGYADPAAVENSLETERAPAQEFTRFAGWAE